MELKEALFRAARLERNALRQLINTPGSSREKIHDTEVALDTLNSILEEAELLEEFEDWYWNS